MRALSAHTLLTRRSRFILPLRYVNIMNTRYRLIFRGVYRGMYYCIDKTTGKRTSLQTTNEDEAQQPMNQDLNVARGVMLRVFFQTLADRS